MLQIVQNNRSGVISVEEVPAPSAAPGQVLVRTQHSLVSAGTEKAGVEFARSSLLGKARSRPDLVQQVFKQVKDQGILSTYKKVKDRLDAAQPLGYSSAGIVVAVGEGVSELRPGMNVACAGVGYASHAEFVSVPVNLTAQIPSGVESQSASYATLGAIALQGIRRAELTPGENVFVLGLGLIGQITVQILKAYGFPVMGVDTDRTRVDSCSNFGMDIGGVVGFDDIQKIALAFTSGVGFDAAVITAATKDNSPVELAGQVVRERGRVSAVGDVGMDIPRRTYYPKEIDFRISRSYGPGRYDTSYEEHGLDYPLAWVRWTEQRNMLEFLRLVKSGRINTDSLTTHKFTISEATDAYSLVSGTESNEPFLGVVIEYPSGPAEPDQSIEISSTPRKSQDPQNLRFGLIGAGNFMSGTLVPALQKIERSSIESVASARGLTAKQLASKTGATKATSDYRSLITADEIDVVVSATQHNLNASIAIETLDAGKSVHVEKPLAINLPDLQAVVASTKKSSGILNVGYNRRFAPLIIKLNQHFKGRTSPLSMMYRVNAGWIEPDHWVHDPVIGGGRILGEVCHFIDLMQFLTDAAPTRVFATGPIPNGTTVLSDDNVIITVDFADHSSGTIVYSSLGAPGQAKERIEVLGDGKSAELNDFKRLDVWSGSKHNQYKSRADKGHGLMLQSFTNAIRLGTDAPIPVEQLANSSLATLAVPESLKLARPVSLNTQSLTFNAADTATI